MAASVLQEAISGASLTAGSATTITATITISAGSRIHATAIGDTGTAATATFSDDSGQGVTWTSHGGPLNISNFRMFDGSSLQFPSGATFTVTCTFASAMSTRGLLLQEIGGADNNAVQDAKSQTQNPLSSGTDVITTPSMTATGAGLVVGVTRNNGGANLTAGTGFTGGTLRWNGSGDPTLGESKHVSAGATASTWSTTSSGGAWWSVGVIFGDAGGASGTLVSSDVARTAPARQQPAQQGAPLPAALKSPWAHLQPTPPPPARRQAGAVSSPLPPPPGVAALLFAPAATAERRVSPRQDGQGAQVLPPMPSPAPPLTQSEPPRGRRPPVAASSNPIPPFPAPFPPILNQIAGPVVRVINRVFAALGLPVVLPPPVNNQVVRPPLVAKVDDLDQAVANVQPGNALAADSIDMAIAGDT